MAEQLPVSYEKWNPFRRPDWRHERVLRMIERMPNPGRSTPKDDCYVRGFRRFILRYRASEDNDMVREHLAHENIGIYASYQLQLKRHDEGEYLTSMIEARILAGQSDEEIAEDLPVRPEAIHWYEALFFGVRDRLKFHDWVVNHVLVPAYQASYEKEAARQKKQQGKNHIPSNVHRPISEPFFDCTMKFFAYFAGPDMLQQVISGFKGRERVSTDQIANYYDTHQRARLRQRSSQASMTFQVNQWNVMELFNIHNNIVMSDRGFESESTVRDNMHSALRIMLNSTPWVVGDEGAERSAASRIAQYDEGAAELRSDELMQVEMGRNLPQLEAVKRMRMPSPGRGEKEPAT